jgi:hypothetical protein
MCEALADRSRRVASQAVVQVRPARPIGHGTKTFTQPSIAGGCHVVITQTHAATGHINWHASGRRSHLVPSSAFPNCIRITCRADPSSAGYAPIQVQIEVQTQIHIPINIQTEAHGYRPDDIPGLIGIAGP